MGTHSYLPFLWGTGLVFFLDSFHVWVQLSQTCNMRQFNKLKIIPGSVENEAAWTEMYWWSALEENSVVPKQCLTGFSDLSPFFCYWTQKQFLTEEGFSELQLRESLFWWPCDHVLDRSKVCTVSQAWPQTFPGQLEEMKGFWNVISVMAALTVFPCGKCLFTSEMA